MILGYGLAKNETGALTLVTCSLRGVGLKEVSVTCFNIMCSLIFFFRLSPAMFKFPKYCSNSFSSLRTKFKVWTFKCKSPYRKHFLVDTAFFFHN